MEVKEIDYAKLNEAIDKFGSLQKATAQLETDKLALEKKNVQLKQENGMLMANRNNLVGQIDDLNAKVKSCQDQLQSLSMQFKEHNYQYMLFCGFITMVTESPSVTDSINTNDSLIPKA